ncbi:hypothetical protein P4T72_11485 [Bacillus nitratireducens]|nr:hypothetical protein [Bacillus nitratireducens]
MPTTRKENLQFGMMMCLGMVFFMSFYGIAMMYLHGGLHGDSFVSIYFSIFMRNFIVAYPLQLMIMGPLVRFLFGKFVMKKKNVEVA